MIKRFSAFLFKDIGWKLLSLLSAIVLWAVVMNIVNPEDKRIILKQITLVGEPHLEANNFIIVNKDRIPTNVQLSISAKFNDFDNPYNTAVIKAVVDLSEIDESYENRLGQAISWPVEIKDLPDVYKLVSWNPEAIPIYLDRMITQYTPVEVHLDGTVKEGYENMPPAYQDTVVVTAPQTIIETISNIRAEVDVQNADKDIIVNEARLHVFDIEGNDITDSVALNVEKIQVRIPVYPIKEVPVKARIAGNPQSGFWVSDIDVSPKTVEIVGPADVLNDIDSIELVPIQLNGATSDITKDFNIWDYLTDRKVSVRSNGVFNVIVTVQILEEAFKHLTLSPGNIFEIRDNNRLVVQLPSDPIPVSIRGPADTVRNISSSTLRGELDLTGLPTGIHDVVLHIALPSNVTITNAPIKLRVVISNEQSTATVLPTESAEPYMPEETQTEEPEDTSDEGNDTEDPDHIGITPTEAVDATSAPHGSEPPIEIENISPSPVVDPETEEDTALPGEGSNRY